MAEETQEQPARAQAEGEAKAAAPAAAPAKAPSPGPARLLVPAGAALAAAGLGIAAGLLLLGPRVAALRAPVAPASAAPVEEAFDEEERTPKKGKSEGTRAVVFELENLIVNPAGSNGTRFLLASVAVEVPDEKVEARLRDRDFQVRDAVIGVLERETLETISAPGGRDSVKARLARRLQPLAGRRAALRVYLPQFVIQ